MVISELSEVPNKYMFSVKHKIVPITNEESKNNNESRVDNEENDLNDLKVPLLSNNMASTLTLYKNYDSFGDTTEALPNNDSSIQQRESVVKFRESEPQENANKNCCVVLSVFEIKYDNPILNFPEVFKALTKNLPMNSSEVINRVSRLDSDCVREICLSGNVELLQEWLELQD